MSACFLSYPENFLYLKAYVTDLSIDVGLSVFV